MFYIIYSCAIEVSETAYSDMTALLDNFVKLNTNNWLLDSFHSVMVIQLHF